MIYYIYFPKGNFQAAPTNSSNRLTFCLLSVIVCYSLKMFMTIILTAYQCDHRREGKGRRFCLGVTIYSIPCRTRYFAQDDFEDYSSFPFKSSWCNSSHNSNRPVQNSYCSKEFNKFCLPNSSDNFCLFFCLLSSFRTCLAEDTKETVQRDFRPLFIQKRKNSHFFVFVKIQYSQNSHVRIVVDYSVYCRVQMSY